MYTIKIFDKNKQLLAETIDSIIPRVGTILIVGDRKFFVEGVDHYLQEDKIDVMASEIK